MSEVNQLSSEDLVKLRNSTLEVLVSLGLIPSSEFSENNLESVFSDFNLSNQALCQKREIEDGFGEDTARDIRILAKEAGNDLKALIPGESSPDISDVEIRFKDSRDKKLLINLLKDFSLKLDEFTNDFKCCYKISEFENEVENLSEFDVGKVGNRREVVKILNSCGRLLELSKDYAKRILQDDLQLGEDNKKLLDFLEHKWQQGEIEGFYQENDGQMKKLNLEDFKEELEEFTTFLEIERKISNRLNNEIESIKELEEWNDTLIQSIEVKVNAS